MTSLWQSSFTIPVDAVDIFLEAEELETFSVSAFEIGARENGDGQIWQIQMIHQSKPDQADLATLLEPIAARSQVKRLRIDVEQFPDENWVEHVQTAFKPFEIGRFWVHGSHVDIKPPVGLVPIQLDAGLAFGSGEHATTEGCLRALDDVAQRRRFTDVLDMGCGSGLLGIAAAKCWPTRVLAVDNDPVAVQVAAENARINHVHDRVACLVSEGYAHSQIRAAGPFDLVLANILADPLCAMARDLAHHIRPGGLAILAGLLDRQAGQVVASHQIYGVFLRNKIKIGPWTILIMSRKKT